MSIENPEHICCLLRDHYTNEFRPFFKKLIKIWPKNIQNEISVIDSLPCACLLVLIQQHLLLNNILLHHRIKPTSSTINKLLNRRGNTKCCRLLQNIHRLQESTDSSSWEICWNLITPGICSKKTILAMITVYRRQLWIKTKKVNSLANKSLLILPHSS